MTDEQPGTRPRSEPGAEARTGAGAGARPDMLLPAADRDEIDHRWTAIETGFVEDPQRHIAMADDLLGDLVDRLHVQLRHDRDRLTGTWKGADVTTEQLRELLLQYRAAYQRLRDIAVPPGPGR